MVLIEYVEGGGSGGYANCFVYVSSRIGKVKGVILV